ncbi:HAD family hydrolase [Alteribacter natronophilus]|uniref:HAD family hydrolase n=1 Tax=Alteribacter natronophilus TaxID=2583810 RepID=UPI00110F26EA|nr:HAD family hydrolase [Alteribacter natronophilus]TMW70104.1 HAD family hydrolase [Alteribacter natronophilus]
MTKRAVLFDLDGTLLNREASVDLFLADQYRRYSETFAKVPFPVYRKRFKDLEKRGYVWKDRVYEQLIEEYRFKGVTAGELLEDYVTRFPKHCVPFPGLEAMLETLAPSFALGIVSNGRTDFQRANIESLGITGFFNSILISEEEGLSKPDKAIFERACERLGTEPEQCLFIGDHPENDVAAAERAGMKGVWIRDAYWQGTDAGWTIDGLEEVPGAVQKWASENSKTSD